MATPDLFAVGCMVAAVLVGSFLGQRRVFDGRLRRRELVVSSVSLIGVLRGRR